MKLLIYPFASKKPIVAFLGSSEIGASETIAGIAHGSLFARIYRWFSLKLVSRECFRKLLRVELTGIYGEFLENYLKKTAQSDSVAAGYLFWFCRSNLKKIVIIGPGKDSNKIVEKYSFDSYSSGLIQNEIMMLEALKETDLSIPKLRGAGEYSDYKYLVQSYISGGNGSVDRSGVFEFLESLFSSDFVLVVEHEETTQFEMALAEQKLPTTGFVGLMNVLHDVSVRTCIEHGDLNESNFVGSAVFDWEYGRMEGFGYFDLMFYLDRSGLLAGNTADHLLKSDSRVYSYVKKSSDSCEFRVMSALLTFFISMYLFRRAKRSFIEGYELQGIEYMRRVDSVLGSVEV